MAFLSGGRLTTTHVLCSIIWDRNSSTFACSHPTHISETARLARTNAERNRFMNAFYDHVPVPLDDYLMANLPNPPRSQQPPPRCVTPESETIVDEVPALIPPNVPPSECHVPSNVSPTGTGITPSRGNSGSELMRSRVDLDTYSDGEDSIIPVNQPEYNGWYPDFPPDPTTGQYHRRRHFLVTPTTTADEERRQRHTRFPGSPSITPPVSVSGHICSTSSRSVVSPEMPSIEQSDSDSESSGPEFIESDDMCDQGFSDSDDEDTAASSPSSHPNVRLVVNSVTGRRTEVPRGTNSRTYQTRTCRYVPTGPMSSELVLVDTSLAVPPRPQRIQFPAGQRSAVYPSRTADREPDGDEETPAVVRMLRHTATPRPHKRKRANNDPSLLVRRALRDASEFEDVEWQPGVFYDFSRPSRGDNDSVPSSESSDVFQAVVDNGANSTVITPEVASAIGNSHITRSQSVVQTGKAGADIPVIGTGSIGELDNVVVVPSGQLRESCISIPRLDISGHWTLFGGQRAYLLDESLKIKAVGDLQDDLTYRWDLRDVVNNTSSEPSDPPARLFMGHAVSNEPTLELLHCRLGHRNQRDIREAILSGRITGIPSRTLANVKSGLCSACACSKSTRRSFRRASTNPNHALRPTVPARKKISVVSTDLKGPMSTTGLNGERYFQLFVEKDTKWRTVKYLTAKSDALKNLQQYVNIDLAAEGSTLQKYHSDGAPELCAGGTKEFLAEKGIMLSYSPPYIPQKNSIVERSHRTIWESAHAMLLASCLPLLLWFYAVSYAVIIDRFLPTNTSRGWMSPYQAKYNVVPDVSSFRVFGCIVFAHIDESLRTSMAEKSYQGYFVGFEWPFFDRVLVFVPELNKVITSGNTVFDEITKIERKVPVMLEMSGERHKLDFNYLIGLIYRDNENSCLYVTTSVRVQQGYIVAPRAAIIDGRRGQEEPRPIHAPDVEIMLHDFVRTNGIQRWDYTTNRIMNVCESIQGAPAELASLSRSDQPTGAVADRAAPGRLEPPVWKPADVQLQHNCQQQSLSSNETVSRSRTRGRPKKSYSSLPTNAPDISDSSSRPTRPSAEISNRPTNSSRPQRNATRNITNANSLGNIGHASPRILSLSVPLSSEEETISNQSDVSIGDTESEQDEVDAVIIQQLENSKHVNWCDTPLTKHTLQEHLCDTNPNEVSSQELEEMTVKFAYMSAQDVVDIDENDVYNDHLN